MAKPKSAFFCQSCGNTSPKWIGKCPACGAWNSFVEEIMVLDKKTTLSQAFSEKSTPQKISEIQSNQHQRASTLDTELDRVLGGGIVPGSVILIGGEPGIGKSTLLLQLACKIKKKVLYVSGEESEQQVKYRSERIGIENEECYILAETSLDKIINEFNKFNPELIIIDSIQTMHWSTIESSAGSVSQIKECSAQIIKYAKKSGCPVFLVGHITKDGNIAGPKILEHMVDTVLQFEGDRNYLFRILRSQKNRYGSASEMGIYEMKSEGLKPVLNPSQLLLSGLSIDLSGSAVAVIIEGIRPLLLEIQALVSSAVYGTPQRSSTGFDNRRLNMLLAVLEKRCGFRLGIKDVFLNVTGGIRLEDTASDLAVIAAILSSNEEIYINGKYCFAGEVGLTGEIRPVSRIEQRIMEAQKLGFEKIFISSFNFGAIKGKAFDIEIIPMKKADDLSRKLF